MWALGAHALNGRREVRRAPEVCPPGARRCVEAVDEDKGNEREKKEGNARCMGTPAVHE
ncbi:MAG: hypothetical protein QOC92_537 [Acidimicrobiaceae bacterium]|jgi:hypothetical protein